MKVIKDIIVLAMVILLGETLCAQSSRIENTNETSTSNRDNWTFGFQDIDDQSSNNRYRDIASRLHWNDLSNSYWAPGALLPFNSKETDANLYTKDRFPYIKAMNTSYNPFLTKKQNPGKYNLKFERGQVESDIVEPAWITHYASGSTSSEDSPRDMASDSSGNIYITGQSSRLPFGTDYLTIKYDSDGEKLWEVRYDGGTNNIAFAINVDLSGNIYVTGGSLSPESNWDYSTIKYDSEGVVQWISRFNGQDNGNDFAYALSVDERGNVYVTGESFRSDTYYDYTTIKYNSDGEEQWIAYYSGTGASDDRAYALTLDDSGNVYVTGESFQNDTFEDYVTIKYSTEGIEEWVAIYNGTGNSTDRATDLTLDRSGNVYVTGSSWGTNNNTDYATIKYNFEGELQWVSRFSALGHADAIALALDNLGNIIVTGSGFGMSLEEYITVKYSVTGEEQWVSVYSGSATDRATSLAVDSSGNIYITGHSSWDATDFISDFATIKYNPDGVEQWISRYDNDFGFNGAVALVEDGLGNICVTGVSQNLINNDITTLKYNSDGEQLWIANYNGPGTSIDWAVSMTADNSGNIFVTGNSNVMGKVDEFATACYSPSGIEQWIVRTSIPASIFNSASAITADNSGNIYITGSSLDSINNSWDIVTIKYNPEGAEQWFVQYDSPENGNDRPNAMTVDNQGNVYITGSSFQSNSSYDYTTLKYNSEGIEQWISVYNGPGNGNDQAKSIVVDDSLYVYVTGKSDGISTNSDYATIKYNPKGEEVWIARFDGNANSIDESVSLALDCSGNVYVTGTSASQSSFDFATIKYDSDGVEQWVKHYDGPENGYDNVVCIAVDCSNNVYVTGESEGLDSYSDYATLKYNSHGDELWVSRYNGLNNGSDWPIGLVVDGTGNIFVSGQSWYNDTELDYVTIMYNPAGEEQLISRFNGPGNDWDIPVSIVIDSSDNVYVTGSSYGVGWSIYSTIRINRNPNRIFENSDTFPKEFKIGQNYPNPFNPTTNIAYDVPKKSKIKIIVYNILGQEISTLVNKEHLPGNYEIRFDGSELASGLYFYRIISGQYIEMKKMILIK